MRSLILALLMTGASCAPPAVPIEETVFNPSLEVDLAASRRLAEGVYVRDLVPPDPYRTRSNTSITQFVAHLADGSEVGAGRVRFIFGQGEVIDGYELGVWGMNETNRRQLIIPPELAYGPDGTDGVPGNAVLVFVVTAMDR